MGFARAVDMEPGFRFDAGGRSPVTFVGVEPVVSRFAGKRRVRVHVRGADPFITDVHIQFRLIGEVGGS
jgi:hypothetical protein